MTQSQPFCSRLRAISHAISGHSRRFCGLCEGSTAPNAAELKPLIAGKVFSVKTSTSTWRLQINDNGYFFINIGSFSDTGTWTVEDGKWCSKPKKSNASCNEMRLSGGSLFMKRDSGEIVLFSPQ